MPEKSYEFENSMDSLAFEVSTAGSSLGSDHEPTSDQEDPNSSMSSPDRGFNERIQVQCLSDLKVLPFLFNFVDDPIEMDDYTHYRNWKVAQSGLFKEVAADLQDLLKAQYPDPPPHDLDYSDHRKRFVSFDTSFASSNLDWSFGSGVGQVNFGHDLLANYNENMIKLDTLPDFLKRDGFTKDVPDPAPFWNYRIPAVTKEDFELIEKEGQKRFKGGVKRNVYFRFVYKDPKMSDIETTRDNIMSKITVIPSLEETTTKIEPHFAPRPVKIKTCIRTNQPRSWNNPLCI